MPEQVEKYFCLEDCCKGQQAMRWTHFLKHQRVAHHRQWTFHFRGFHSTIDFQVWFKFVQKNFLRLPVVREVGSSLHATCNIASSTTCPARLFAKRLQRKLGILVLYMGEHYGHDHLSERGERLFLLDYCPLIMKPVDQWLFHFRHSGVILATHSTPFLALKARQLELESKRLVVVGFMNEQQLGILVKFHRTICLNTHGNWIVMFSLAVHADDHTKPPLALPVAYCYSNLMDETIITDFFLCIRNITSVLKSVLVVSNNEKLFKGAWKKVFPESKSIFMQSWQGLLDKLILSTNQFNYDEAREMEAILRKSILREYPNIENITNEFLKAVQLSKILNVGTIISLSEWQHQASLVKLLDEWIGEQIAAGSTKSFRDSMFSFENYYIIRALMSDDVPTSMMHLTLHLRHVLDKCPPLENLVNLVCSVESTE